MFAEKDKRYRIVVLSNDFNNEVHRNLGTFEIYDQYYD